MNFKEFKKEALSIVKEDKRAVDLNVTHPLTKKKNDLKMAFIENTGGIELDRRHLQLKRLRFNEAIGQFVYQGIKTEEGWQKLFDEVEKITCEDVQRVLEEEERKRKENETEQKERIKYLKKQELAKIHKQLTVSERAVNYLYGQLKMKGVARFGSSGQELNYKLMWAVDFLSSELSKQCGFDKGKKGDELVLFKTPFEFFHFVGNIKEGLVPFNDTFVDLQFKASDVRKWLGFTSDEMSIKDVVDLFRGLQRVIFEVDKEPILRDAEKKEWVETSFSDTLFSLRRDNLGIVSNRWKTKDVILTLRFGNIMSWLFIANLSCGKEGLITLPKEARHELDGFGQNVLRWLRLWKTPRKIVVSDLANIAGLKYKEAYRLITALKRILTDLKDKCYIKDFEATGKGKDTWFVIVK